MTVAASTIAAVLAAADAACPGLCCWGETGLSPDYLLALNGAQFSDDLSETLPPEAVIVLLGAESGG